MFQFKINFEHMKTYQTSEIKNIALVGCSKSGKTTLVEAMLYEWSYKTPWCQIKGKNNASDYFPVEQEYGYSVFSTATYIPNEQQKN